MRPRGEIRQVYVCRHLFFISFSKQIKCKREAKRGEGRERRKPVGLEYSFSFKRQGKRGDGVRNPEA